MFNIFNIMFRFLCDYCSEKKTMVVLYGYTESGFITLYIHTCISWSIYMSILIQGYLCKLIIIYLSFLSLSYHFHLYQTTKIIISLSTHFHSFTILSSYYLSFHFLLSSKRSLNVCYFYCVITKINYIYSFKLIDYVNKIQI